MNSVFVNYGRLYSTVAFPTVAEGNAYMATNDGMGFIGTAPDGMHHIAAMADKGSALPAVRNLRCCCCGEAVRGRQFPNQDTGYGLGACCVERVAKHGDDMTRTYGVRGVHYDIQEEN